MDTEYNLKTFVHDVRRLSVRCKKRIVFFFFFSFKDTLFVHYISNLQKCHISAKNINI